MIFIKRLILAVQDRCKASELPGTRPRAHADHLYRVLKVVQVRFCMTVWVGHFGHQQADTEVALLRGTLGCQLAIYVAKLEHALRLHQHHVQD